MHDIKYYLQGEKKMKMFFHVYARTVWDEEGKPHKMFGIDAVSEEGIVQNSVIDAFDNYEKAEEFARKCTELELAPEHLREVIEDVLIS